MIESDITKLRHILLLDVSIGHLNTAYFFTHTALLTVKK